MVQESKSMHNLYGVNELFFSFFFF